MKNKIKASKDAKELGCKTGCLTYIVLALILAWLWNEDDGPVLALCISIVIGYGVYKASSSKYVKQEAEKKKKAADAVKKEINWLEDKLAKIKSDAGVEEETEEDQKKRYQKYLDSIKKRK